MQPSETNFFKDVWNVETFVMKYGSLTMDRQQWFVNYGLSTMVRQRLFGHV